MHENLDSEISDDEFLYRGVIEQNWDFENDRPSSATFKDSNGVSVDRDGSRSLESCIQALKASKAFFAICRVKASAVRNNGAVIKYLPEPDNIYHSEIHDSHVRVQMRGSKPKKIRDDSEVVDRYGFTV